MAGRQQGRFWRHWWWAVLAGGVACAGVVAALAGGTRNSAAPSGLVQPVPVRASSPMPASPGSSGPAHSSRPKARGPAASPAVASSRAVLTPPATVSVPPVPRQAKASLTKWGDGPGGTALNLISRQLGNSAQAAGVRLYFQMQQACGQLSTAVRTAQAGPPIPEPTLEHLYATALVTLAAGAGHCQAGISAGVGGESATVRVNQALIQQARQEFAAGSRDLYLATSQIRLAHSHR